MLRLLNMMRLLIRGEYGELRGMIFQIFPGHRRLVQWLYSLAGNRIGMSIGSFGLKLVWGLMILGRVPSWADLETLIRVRNEAHRFAIRYHKDVRSREFVKPLH